MNLETEANLLANLVANRKTERNPQIGKRIGSWLISTTITPSPRHPDPDNNSSNKNATQPKSIMTYGTYVLLLLLLLYYECHSHQERHSSGNTHQIITSVGIQETPHSFLIVVNLS